MAEPYLLLQVQNYATHGMAGTFNECIRPFPLFLNGFPKFPFTVYNKDCPGVNLHGWSDEQVDKREEMTMETKYHLKIQTGPESGSEFLLEKPELFLGRDPGNDLVITDPEVSRRHARLVLNGPQFAIEDLGSTNGTFVQGTQIHGLTTLNPGDIIAIGERVVLLYDVTVFDPDATMAVPRAVEEIPETPLPVSPPISTLPPESSEPHAGSEPVAPQREVFKQRSAEPAPVLPSVAAPSVEKEVDLEPPTPLAGNLPAQPRAEKRRSPWGGIILIIVLLILIFIVIPWIIIDITSSYCLFVPGILNAIEPGVCP